MSKSNEVVGYFQWRKSSRGVPQPSKILKVHRDMRAYSHNHQEVDGHHYGLLKEHPLDAELWAMPLDALAKVYGDDHLEGMTASTCDAPV